MTRGRFSGKTRKRPAAETKAMREYLGQHKACEACGMEAARDCHHIVSEKTGGPAEDWNFLALCFYCHVPGFHTLGWKRFCDRFPHLAQKIVTARIKMGRKTE